MTADTLDQGESNSPVATLRPTVPAPAGSRLLLLSHQSPGTTGNATAALVTAVTDISSAFYWGPAEREREDEVTGLPARSSLLIIFMLGNRHKGGQSGFLPQPCPISSLHLLEDLLKEQALFSWSGTWSAEATFRWQVIYIWK